MSLFIFTFDWFSVLLVYLGSAIYAPMSCRPQVWVQADKCSRIDYDRQTGIVWAST